MYNPLSLIPKWKPSIFLVLQAFIILLTVVTMELNKDAINLKKKLDKIKQKKLCAQKMNENVQSIDNDAVNISKEEILSEYFLFLKNFQYYRIMNWIGW